MDDPGGRRSEAGAGPFGAGAAGLVGRATGGRAERGRALSRGTRKSPGGGHGRIAFGRVPARHGQRDLRLLASLAARAFRIGRAQLRLAGRAGRLASGPPSRQQVRTRRVGREATDLRFCAVRRAGTRHGCAVLTLAGRRTGGYSRATGKNLSAQHTCVAVVHATLPHATVPALEPAAPAGLWPLPAPGPLAPASLPAPSPLEALPPSVSRPPFGTPPALPQPRAMSATTARSSVRRRLVDSVASWPHIASARLAGE